jgi:hypothetical protein
MPVEEKADPMSVTALVHAGAPAIINPDNLWNMIQQVMKHAVPDEINLYGKPASKVNAEKCHLVGTTMIPEITRPMLYQTPSVCNRRFHPERGFYMFPEKVRDAATYKLLRWDMKALFKNKSPERMQRVRDYLSVMGVHYFIACADCNMAHTGKWQIYDIVKDMYNLDSKKQKPDDIFTIYTLIFDCMADDFSTQPPTINIDEERILHWQLEIWLNYCTLMFMAQQHKNEVYFYNVAIH